MHRFLFASGLAATLAAGCVTELPEDVSPSTTTKATIVSMTGRHHTLAHASATGAGDDYVVVMKAEPHGRMAKRDRDVADAAMDRLAGAHRAQINRRYASALRGFSARMTDADAHALAADPEVAIVEKVQKFHASAIQNNATQGIDRIDQRNLPLDGRYDHVGDGAGATAFIIDTGVRDTHVEFTGRMLPGATAIDDGNGTDDCQGHGTHVAGTVAGTTFGVAKLAKIVPIRVLGCDGSGSTDGIIAGLDFVAQNHPQGSVANMSLGGGASAALDTAVRNLIASGVTVAVAAGNESQDACNVSPAREPLAITVGSTTVDDVRSGFSNFGACVDLFAPGSEITSAGIASDTSTAILNGTSMATPHVAGVAALFLGTNPTASPAQVAASILASSTPNKISDLRGSPDRLLFSKVTAAPDPGPGTPLDISITSPQNGATVQATFDVFLNVSPNAVAVVVGLDGTQLGQLEGAPTGFTLENVEPGQHTVEVVAIDAQNQGVADGVNVTVAGGANPNPNPNPNPPPPPPPPFHEEPGGCSASGGGATGALGFVMLALAAVLRRRRR